jgi:hypothetical protein
MMTRPLLARLVETLRIAAEALVVTNTPSTAGNAPPVVTVGTAGTFLRCRCNGGRGERSIRKRPKRKKEIFKKNNFTSKPILNRHLVIPQGLGRASDSRGQSPSKPILNRHLVIPQGLERASDSRGQNPSKPILNRHKVILPGLGHASNSQKRVILSNKTQNVLIGVLEIGFSDLDIIVSLDGINVDIPPPILAADLVAHMAMRTVGGGVVNSRTKVVAAITPGLPRGVGSKEERTK